MAEHKVARPLPAVEVVFTLPAHVARDLDTLATAWRATPDDLAALALARLLNQPRRGHDGQRSGGTPEPRTAGHLPPDPHPSRNRQANTEQEKRHE